MRRYARSLALLVIGSLLFYTLYQPRARISTTPYPPGCDATEHDDIDTLIRFANVSFTELLAKQSHDVNTGAAAYRARRGRHPPPGYAEWYAHALSKKAVIIEDFFDQIYKDIEPFWGAKPSFIRSTLHGWDEIVTIRDGKVVDVPNNYVRTRMWVDMLKQISSMLPDMDIAFNHLDEPRVIVPYTLIETAIAGAQVQKWTVLSKSAAGFNGTLAASSRKEEDTAPPKEELIWHVNKHQWQRALKDSCRPNSAMAQVSIPFNENVEPASHLDMSIVQNTTAVKDVCHDTWLIKQHGAIEEPATIDFTTSLMPIFTGSKLPNYNDIVIPEPSYYSDAPEFTGKDFYGDRSNWYSWLNKKNGLVWRGSATGGGIHDHNFKIFHRQRLVSHMNATENDPILTGPRKDHAARLGSSPAEFQDFLAAKTDAGFTKIFCDYYHVADGCPDLASHYSLVKKIKMGSQYKWKYLPDVDGNSISERFRAFLLSNSAPIKASIFDDWQDYRLQSWQHYIPMSMSFDDLYYLMAYFLGYGKTCAHDEAGRRIAENGRDWAKQVLRREDMVIYMHRVLLEYARVVHDNRDHLGWVDDLMVR